MRDWNDGLSSSSVGDVSIKQRRLELASPGDTVSSAPDDSPWLRQAEGDVLAGGSPKKLLFQQGAEGEKTPQALRMQALKVRDVWLSRLGCMRG